MYGNVFSTLANPNAESKNADPNACSSGVITFDAAVTLDQQRQRLPEDTAWTQELERFNADPLSWEYLFRDFDQQRNTGVYLRKQIIWSINVLALLLIAIFAALQFFRASVTDLFSDAMLACGVTCTSELKMAVFLKYWHYILYQPRDSRVREKLAPMAQQIAEEIKLREMEERVQHDWTELQRQSLPDEMLRSLKGSYAAALDASKAFAARMQAAEILSNHLRRAARPEPLQPTQAIATKLPRQVGDSPRQLQLDAIHEAAEISEERLKPLSLKELDLLQRALVLLGSISKDAVAAFIAQELKPLLKKDAFEQAIFTENAQALAMLVNGSPRPRSITPPEMPAINAIVPQGNELLGKRVLVIGGNSADARRARYLEWVKRLRPASVRFVSVDQTRKLSSALATSTVDLVVVIKIANSTVREILQGTNTPWVIIPHLSETRFLNTLLEFLAARSDDTDVACNQ